jgi:hypothetical protein
MLAVLERFVQDHANCDLDWAEFSGMALPAGERGEAPKWLARVETDGWVGLWDVVSFLRTTAPDEWEAMAARLEEVLRPFSIREGA